MSPKPAGSSTRPSLLRRPGDRERAYDLARTAYLDHFELAEVPLRLRDPNLVLDLEFSFAKLRNGIRDGAPMSELESDAVADPRRARRCRPRRWPARGSRRRCSPSASRSRSCSARESRRCCCSRSCSARSSAGRASGLPAAARGSASSAALVATAAHVGAGDGRARHRAGAARAARGVTAVAAVVVLFAVSFWLVSRLEHRHWMEFMRARVGVGDRRRQRRRVRRARLHRRLPRGLRDRALLPGARDLRGGPGALGRARRRRPPWSPSASVGLRGPEAREAAAAEADADRRRGDPAAACRSRSPATPCARCRRPTGSPSRRSTAAGRGCPIFVAELTGIHPTREGLIVQAALLAGLRPRRRLGLRRPAAAPARRRGGGARVSRRDRGSASTSAARSRRPSRSRPAPLSCWRTRSYPTTHDARRRRRGRRRRAARRSSRSSARTAAASSSSRSRRRRR